MIKDKEKNFVSAVVYIGENPELVKPFLDMINGQLGDNFEQYEIICVNDACRMTAEEVRGYSAHGNTSAPVTLVNMSVKQGVELCMNAGIDISIGDYVFEFDSMLMPYEPSLVFDCYKKGQEGFDIVTATPKKKSRFTSRLFYNLFNASSHSEYKLVTDSFHLLSRRAINRLHAINPCMPYRKAAYAASGLRLVSVGYEPEGEFSAGREYRMTQAIDALALYTNAAFKLSFGISFAMLLVALFSVLYTVVIYIAGKPIEGWTTTMLLLSGGFFGVFLLFTFVIKYLSLIADLVFRNQKYLVESVEKIQYE
ncbi:MAG: glycosyl transferase family 2 [Oscillospiraceae bacterium]